MNKMIVLVMILIIGIIIALEARYDVIVNSPVVAKVDHLTGDVYIANSGMWFKVQNMPQGPNNQMPPMPGPMQQKQPPQPRSR